MDMEKSNRQDALAVFHNLLTCGHTIYSYQYSADGELLYTNSPRLAPHHMFVRSGCLRYALDNTATDKTPLCLGTQLGLMWGAVRGDESEADALYVIGPVLNTDLPNATIKQAVRRMVKDPVFQNDIESYLESLPVVPNYLLQGYILMLCFCVNGERLAVSDIRYQKSAGDIPAPRKHKEPTPDRHQTYMAERALLYCVREGDLNYQSALSKAASLSSGIRIHTQQPVNQAIISAASFTSLCTRAAIEGGLLPDTAYTVGDGYIQSLISCTTVSEVGAINHAMYEDFIRRVRKQRESAPLTKQIRSCKEYIELHPEEDLSLSRLAAMAGYTDYHLSKKFKAETGESINDYINYVRIERAKLLLETTTMPIAEIAAMLQYCSTTYFGTRFREVTGMLPSVYRKEKQAQ